MSAHIGPYLFSEYICLMIGFPSNLNICIVFQILIQPYHNNTFDIIYLYKISILGVSRYKVFQSSLQIYPFIANSTFKASLCK